MATQKKSSKMDRHRKSAQNLNYKSANRHEKSHCRRIKKHLARYGHDKVAVTALMAYATKAGVREFGLAHSFLRGQGWSQ